MDRRWRLEQAIDASAHVLPARRLPDHGLMAWDVVKQRGYEGLVAKEEQSAYRVGPTRSWLKLKVRYEGVFVVGGLLGTPEAVEAVLVGERVGRRLCHRGHGRLTPTIGPQIPNAYRLAIACPCGVTFERWVTPHDALEDLLRTRLRAERN